MDNKIVVVGNAGIDTNIFLNGLEIDFNVEANFTENIDFVGQAGGYTSRGFAQLGINTAFIGYRGDDFSGEFLLKEFLKDNIRTDALFIDPQGTARSVNILYPDGRRKNFYDGKGHMRLQPDLVKCAQVLAGARLAHFHIPNWARELLPVARSLGAIIACDLQDMVILDDSYRMDFIKGADILFFSAANLKDPSTIIQHLMSANPHQIIVCGLGADGCAAGAKGKIYYYPPIQIDQPIIDTNGAGDGLAVGFLSSYVIDGYTLEDSVLRGQIAARFTCSIRASSSHLINSEQLNLIYKKIKSDF